MTYEEFLEALQGHDTIIFRTAGVGETECPTKDLTEIESAVKKQMPKQPILEDMCAKRCPTCSVRHYNPRWMAEYCEDCGQKLDWR